MLPAVFCVLLLAGVASASEAEHQIHHHIHKDEKHTVLIRPPGADGGALPVKIGFNLNDVDVVGTKATVSGWVHMMWNNKLMAWDDAEDHSSHGVTQTRMTPAGMWVPDIMPYNMIPCPDWVVRTNAVVKSNGDVFYVPLVSFAVRCQREVNETSERLVCPIKVGSWTYSGNELDLQANVDHADLSTFAANGEWAVESADITREENKYDCCDELYPSLIVHLVLKPQHS